MTAETIQIIVGVTQALTSVILAILTLIYVVLTRRISRASIDTVKQLFIQQRPAVVIRLQPTVTTRLPHLLQLDAINLGTGPAIDLAVRYVASGAPMNVTQGALSSFLPGASSREATIRVQLEGSEGNPLPPNTSGADFALGVVLVSYSDIHGGNYTSRFELFINSMHKVLDRVIA